MVTPVTMALDEGGDIEARGMAGAGGDVGGDLSGVDAGEGGDDATPDRWVEVLRAVVRLAEAFLDAAVVAGYFGLDAPTGRPAAVASTIFDP
jgi:hypothetical protein